MSKAKYWIKDHQDNITSIVGLLAILSAVVLAYVYDPRLLNTFLVNRLNAETIGSMLKVEKNIVMHEDHLGGRVKTGGFTVTYQYDIADSTYQKKEYVDRKSIDRKAELFLLALNPGHTILVRYNPKNPSIARWLPGTNGND